MNFVDQGHGSPALVFVHGLSGSLKAWAAQLDRPWPGHRCIAVDLPGHGKSPPLPSSTVASVAAATNDLLDRLQLDDVVLVGHSMGCRVVLEMFSQSARRVRALVLVDGGLSEGDPQENLRRWERYIQETEAAAASKGRDTRTQRQLWIDYVHWDATRAQEVLRSVDVPVLLLQATTTDENRRRRRIRPGEQTAWTALVSQSAKAQVVFEHVPDSGHFIMRDAAARMNDRIEAFLARIGPAAARS